MRLVYIFLVTSLLIGLVGASYNSCEIYGNCIPTNNFVLNNGDDIQGTYNFNGGWTNGGITLQDGDGYFQTLYIYNITSLNVTQQNLTVLENAYYLGKVGIGTTSPSSLLQVGGSTYTATTDGIASFIGSASVGVNNLDLIIKNTNGNSNSRTDRILFQHYNGLTGGYIASGRDDIYTSSTNADSNLQFATSLDGTDVERVRIDSSGNVGIGTSNPDELLHIEQNVVGTLGFKIANINENSANRASSIIFQQYTGNGGQIYAGREGKYNGTATEHDSYLAFYTAEDNVDIERVRITSAGNVGIGTTSPLGLLQVGGGLPSGFEADQYLVFQNSYANANNNGIQYYLADGTTLRGYAYWDNSEDLKIKGDLIHFDTQNKNDSLVIDADGNVGIGTTSPTHKLNVLGDINVTGNLSMESPDGTWYSCGVLNGGTWACS